MLLAFWDGCQHAGSSLATHICSAGHVVLPSPLPSDCESSSGTHNVVAFLLVFVEPGSAAVLAADWLDRVGNRLALPSVGLPRLIGQANMTLCV